MWFIFTEYRTIIFTHRYDSVSYYYEKKLSKTQFEFDGQTVCMMINQQNWQRQTYIAVNKLGPKSEALRQSLCLNKQQYMSQTTCLFIIGTLDTPFVTKNKKFSFSFSGYHDDCLGSAIFIAKRLDDDHLSFWLQWSPNVHTMLSNSNIHTKSNSSRK